jgi:hypothetical protein
MKAEGPLIIAIRSPYRRTAAVGGNFMADDFRGLQIDDQLELGWLFDREIGRLCTAQPKQDSCAIRSADAHLV